MRRRHWRPKLTDHDVELMLRLLDDRRRLAESQRRAGALPGVIDRTLHAASLSYMAIAEKFEVSKTLVAAINRGERRQGVAR